MKCIIIEREKNVVENLANYVQQVPGVQLTGTFLSTTDGILHIQSNPTDIVIASFAFYEEDLINKWKDSLEIILLIDNPADAMKAYDLGASGCLLKPVIFSRFLQSINRVQKIVENKKKADARYQGSHHRFIFIKTEYKLMKINFDDIAYMEGLKDYTKVYLKDTIKPIITLQNLKAFENKLPSDEFIRVHRSYIVAINKINLIYKNRIVLGKADIPISDGFKSQINEIIEQHS